MSDDSKIPDREGIESETERLEWASGLRPFRPLNKENFRRLAVWTVVICLGLILFKEFILALALLSLLFFSYVMGTVPPLKIKHALSSNGLTTADHTYLWNELRSFYFERKLDSTILVVETAVRPSRLTIVVENNDEVKVRELLSKYLPFREAPPKRFIENLTEKAAQLLNLA